MPFGRPRRGLFQDPYSASVPSPADQSYDGGGADYGRMPRVFGSGGSTPGQSFGGSDPDTQRLMDFITQRMGQLDDPADPALSSIIGQLMSPWTNPYQGQIDETLNRVLSEISGPAYSASEDASRRAAAFGNIEAGRDSGIRRETARLASLGHGRSSGTIADAIRGVNASTDQNRAMAERDLAIEATQKTERNRALATQIAQLRGSMEAQAAGINSQRLGQAGSLQAALAQLDRSRGAEALQLSMLPVQLNDSRLDRAMQLLGLTGGLSNPQNVLQSLMGLVGQTSQNNAYNDQRNAQFWGGLGTAIGGINWGDLFGGAGA